MMSQHRVFLVVETLVFMCAHYSIIVKILMKVAQGEMVWFIKMPNLDIIERNDFIRVCTNLTFEMSKFFADSPCMIISIP